MTIQKGDAEGPRWKPNAFAEKVALKTLAHTGAGVAAVTCKGVSTEEKEVKLLLMLMHTAAAELLQPELVGGWRVEGG